MAIFDKKLLIKKKKDFFSTYWSNKKCFPYTPLTSCQKSKKSNDRKYDNFATFPKNGVESTSKSRKSHF